MEPFASKYRPKTLDDFVGQKHLINKNSILQNLLNKKIMKSSIFYGLPGTGKTTLAKIIAEKLKIDCVILNAVDLSVKEIREVIPEEGSKLVVIDEIHLITKKSQQVLLEAVENGRVILIGITTENPYFSINGAILSRCLVFEFKEIKHEESIKRIKDVIKLIQKDYNVEVILEDNFLEQLVLGCNGDLRNILNRLETIFLKNLNPFSSDVEFKISDLEEFGINMDVSNNLYNLLSSFHKSMRGSATDAALIYLGKILQGGNSALQPITRRILACVSEDIGMANPEAIMIVKACVDSALILGWPEARLPLAEAVIFICNQPKSNSCILAIDNVMRDLETKDMGEIPDYLHDGHYAGAKKLGKSIGYKYPHDYEDNWVKQEYMPSNFVGNKYYIPGNNKIEKLYEEYWKEIKGN